MLRDQPPAVVHAGGDDALAAPPPTRSIRVECVGQRIDIVTSDACALRVIARNFDALRVDDAGTASAGEFVVRPIDGVSFVVEGPAVPRRMACGFADVVYAVEKELTLGLQRSRPDLLFLHAAAVERQGRAFLLAAESGRGKSTTTWGLLHHGFGYLSDELAPVDLVRLEVHPYAHALCLKRHPPTYPLPDEAVDFGRTIHVPTDALPARVVTEPLPLGGVFFVSHVPDLAAPEIRPVGRAEAAARLYVTCLNALSHPEAGLAAVVRIVEGVPCFRLETGALPETCSAVAAAITKTGTC